MSLIDDDDAKYLRESFAELAVDVNVAVVVRERPRLVVDGEPAEPGDSSTEVAQIVDEVAATSPRLKVERVAADGERGRALSGERVPALVLSSASSRGRLRYFGAPAGYEMSTLISTLMDLGSGEAMVPPDIAGELAELAAPVHIQVFVTPSCPHCPAMARAAFQLAMASPQIVADVVEVQEFPDVAEQYQVRGVPMTVVNDGEPLMGNVGGARLLAAVRAAARPA